MRFRYQIQMDPDEFEVYQEMAKELREPVSALIRRTLRHALLTPKTTHEEAEPYGEVRRK